MPLKTNWFVFYVQGRREEFLCNRLNTIGEDIVAFVPKIERMHKREGIAGIVVKPLFPGYLFIRTNEDYTCIQQLYVRCRQQLSGIKKQLKYDEAETSALTQPEIKFLENILDEEYVLKMSRGIILNNSLHIHEGPLMGREKDIKYIDRHKCTAKLFVEILGRQVLAGLEVVSKNEGKYK